MASLGAGSSLRTPNPADRPVMSKRAWWLLLLNLLIPGSAQVLAGSRRLGRFGLGATLLFWALLVAAVITYLLSPTVLYTLGTTVWGLWLIQGFLVGYAVLWLLLTLDAFRLARLGRVEGRWRAVLAGFTVLSLVALTGTAAYGAYLAGVTRGTIGGVFAQAPVEPPINGRYNILLLGGDAGPDRQGMRPDSISVVSIDAATGKATTIGLPRDLTNIPFSAGSPMLKLYPNGYDNHCNVDVCLLNSIYTEVSLKSPELYPNAVAAGSEPGIEGMRDAVQGALGITIQYYVLIDMQGFSSLIDALGGVTINVTQRLPIGGGVNSAGQLINVGAWIEPGTQRMDGNTALWYARSRYGSAGGDYDRMKRQREVQAAILQQFDPANVLAKFEGIAAASAKVVKTDIPQGTLGAFVDLAMKAKGQQVTSLELVPPTVDPANPDYPAIRQLVAQALATPSPTPAP